MCGSVCDHFLYFLPRCCENLLPFLGVPVYVPGSLSSFVSGAASSPATTLCVALWPQLASGAPTVTPQTAVVRGAGSLPTSTVLSAFSNQLAKTARRQKGRHQLLQSDFTPDWFAPPRVSQLSQFKLQQATVWLYADQQESSVSSYSRVVS